MPTYSYRCGMCGEFDVHRAMAERGEHEPCPACGAVAPRLFGAPAVRRLAPGVRAALDASGRSADAPDVVSAVPGRPRRRQQVSTDPRHARLPRP